MLPLRTAATTVASGAPNHKLKSMSRAPQRIRAKADKCGPAAASSGPERMKERAPARAQSNRVFLLSPAYAGGERARMIMSDRAQFELARKLRSKEGATLAEVFTFLSGLYFRGKIAYANTFARVTNRLCGAVVITPTRGLVDAQTRISLDDLREFAEVDIDEEDPRYRKPLERDVRTLAAKLSAQCEAVLLGSIASNKYVDVLLAHFGERLRFPVDFVGRGDMSRGGLLLRCAADRQELTYVSVAGAVLRGARPPKLEPRRYPKNSSI
jgi:hypothetical protein